MVEMMSNALTNAGKHVTSNVVSAGCQRFQSPDWPK